MSITPTSDCQGPFGTVRGSYGGISDTIKVYHIPYLGPWPRTSTKPENFYSRAVGFNRPQTTEFWNPYTSFWRRLLNVEGASIGAY